MRDWQRLVTERLANLDLPPDVREEVVAEIAGHLEDCHSELSERPGTDADMRTLAQVRDWTRFRRRVQRAKEEPMSFIRKVVLPGVVAAVIGLLSLKLMIAWLITPTACHLGDGFCIEVSAEGPVYLPWLATLPLAGALAAALARRMGARPAGRLLAALAPAIYLSVEILVVSVMGPFYWRIPIYWALIPAMACAIGALPFLRGGRGPEAVRPDAPATSRPSSPANGPAFRSMETA